jgi:hypothetical protein
VIARRQDFPERLVCACVLVFLHGTCEKVSVMMLTFDVLGDTSHGTSNDVHIPRGYGAMHEAWNEEETKDMLSGAILDPLY